MIAAILATATIVTAPCPGIPDVHPGCVTWAEEPPTVYVHPKVRPGPARQIVLAHEAGHIFSWRHPGRPGSTDEEAFADEFASCFLKGKPYRWGKNLLWLERKQPSLCRALAAP